MNNPVPLLTAEERSKLEALERMMKSYKSVAYAQWPAEAHAADAAIRKAKGEV